MESVPAAPDVGMSFRDYLEMVARRKWVAVGVDDEVHVGGYDHDAHDQQRCVQ